MVSNDNINDEKEELEGGIVIYFLFVFGLFFP